jgi:hypothetical protein
MRVCYLIQSHREPRQIARLVQTLGRHRPHSLVIVAHDESSSTLDRRSLGDLSEVHYLPLPGPVRRGYLSMLDPYLRGVEFARRRQAGYDWLVYISGQDYPTRPLAESEAALAAADADGFIRWWPALGADGPWRRRHQGLRRYYYRYRDAPRWCRPLLPLLKALNGVQSLLHVHLAYGPRVGRRARRTPFDAGRVCYAGWQWTTLRRACAEYVLEQVEREPYLVDYYGRTICPDESLVQTLLVNSGRFRLVNDNLRYASTEGHRQGQARLLGVADLPLLESGGFHFARKFDLAHDARVLDLLDERLGEDPGL